MPYIVSLASDESDTMMALRSDGAIFCWGESPGGSCGLKTGYGACVPTQVDAETCAVGVALGYGIGASVSATHRVQLWGDEGPDYLAFGNGPEPIGLRPAQTISPELWAPVAKLSASGHTVFALTTTGQVYWWGIGGPGGGGPASFSSYPQPLSLPRRAVDMAKGCALLDNGDVYCYGGNDGGRLGVGRADAFVTMPTRVLFDRPVLSISIDSNLCGVLDDHSVACAGTMLPGPDPINLPTSNVPVRIEGFPPVDRVYTFDVVRCAYPLGGQVYCFGDTPFDSDGHFGSWSAVFAVPELPDILDMVKTTTSLCVLRSDHSVWCEGSEAGTSCFGNPKLVQAIPPPGGP